MRIVKNDIIEKNFYICLFSFSLIISENFFFLWHKRFLLHPSYLFFNTFFLFLSSLILFYIIFSIKKNFQLKNKIDYYFTLTLFTYVIVKLIEILFFYSNIINLTTLFEKFFLFFLNDGFLILFLKKLAPYILIFTLIYFFFSKKLHYLQRFIFSFSLIFFIIMLINIFNRYENYEKTNLNYSKNDNNKKVLWIVFDEFDPAVAFKNNHNLKNFQNLKQSSFVLNNSYSPSSHTFESISSIFTSKNVKNLEFDNYKIYLKIDESKKIEFNFENTFFSDLKLEKFKFNVFSEVLPYCFILGLENNCEKDKNNVKNYFDGVISLYTPIKYLEIIKNKLRKFDNYDEKKISYINNKFIPNDKFFISEELGLTLDDIDNELKSDNNFSFIHLFLPKEKQDKISTISVSKFYNMSSDDNFERYNMNVNYIDLILKGITNKIKKYEHKDILLILSSDHWYRLSGNEVKPSLFIAKIFNDEEGISSQKKVMNTFIPKLVLNFLNEKVKSHNDIDRLIYDLDEISISDIKNNLK